MGQLTQEAERRMLLWALQDSTNTSLAFTQPMVVRLVSTNGDAVAAGVQVLGDTYTEQEAYFAQTATTPGVELVNTSTIEFNSLDLATTVTVAGAEMWDSSDTPVRVAFAALSDPVPISAGNPFIIGTGQLKVRLT